MIEDLELIKNINILSHNEIILYGTGSLGKKCLKWIKGMRDNHNGIFFCDSNELKEGMIIDGVKIISLNTLKSRKGNASIIITSTFVNEIYSALEENGLNEKIYTYWGLGHCLAANLDSELLNEDFRKKYKSAIKVWRYLKQKMDFGDAIYEHTMKTVFEQAMSEHPFLIYTGGRVGTAEIEKSIKQYNIEVAATHAFPIITTTRTLRCGEWFADMDPVKEEYILWRNLLKQKKMKIITLIREPIAQDLSGFFLAMDTLIWHNSQNFNKDIAKSAEQLIKEHSGGLSNVGIFNWFNTEFRKFTGVDIYQHPFNREEGYAWIEKDNFEILVIQSEKVHNLEKVIGKFIGIEDFKIISKTIGINMEDTIRKYPYREFIEKVKLSKEYVENYYKNNSNMNHIYSKEDQELFLRKWKKNIQEA